MTANQPATIATSERHEPNGARWWTFPLLDEPWLVHGVFSRLGGESDRPFASLNGSVTVGDDARSVDRNRALVRRSLGAPNARMAMVRQVHGVTMHAVHDDWPFMAPGRDAHSGPLAAELSGGLRGNRVPPAGDGLMSNQPDVLLLLAFADCAPILLVDKRRRVVALAHAGWRGTVAGMATRAVRSMHDTYGSDPSDVVAAIGPCIGPCCYAVGPEVARAVDGANDDAVRRALHERGDGAWTFDLAAANESQLLAAGVRRAVSADLCTACHTDLLYSHRAEHGRTGRFMVAIALKGGER